MGPAADLDAANAAAQRINHATRNGKVIRGGTVSGGVCPAPDLPEATPDECVPC